GGLHDGLGEAGGGDGLARLVDRDVLADRVVELAAAGELDTELEALGRDARDGDDERRGRDAQPRVATLHQLRVLAVQPGADLAEVAEAADGGTARDGLVGQGEVAQD